MSGEADSATVFIFPGARGVSLKGDETHPATALTERLTAMLAGANVVHCTDALCRMLAAICCCNAVTETDAIETAQLIAKDIEELTRGMMAPDAPGAGEDGA